MTGHRADAARGRDEIRRALAGADPWLLRAAVRLATEDDELERMRGFRPPAEGTDRIQLPSLAGPADAERVVRAAQALIERVRAGRQPIRTPDRRRFRRVLETTIGEPVSYADEQFWWEEFALDPSPRRSVLSDPAGVRPGAVQVLIIGAGISGISLGVHLGQAGVPYTVLEQNPGVGGTWHDNRYPGARVDVASRAYSFSFESSYRWKHHFALAGEVREYLEYVADRHEVTPHIRFGRSVTSLCWDENAGEWLVEAAHDGRAERYRANIVISAVGLFARPRLPAIPGIETFAGTMIHTARWDETADLGVKSVGLIGTGSSGVQIASPLSMLAGELTIFQRSGTWVTPTPRYLDEVSDDEQWVLDTVPFYLNWLRLAQVYEIGDARRRILEIDPDWTDPTSVSPGNARLRDSLTAYMEAQVGDDPELRRACTPSYPPLAKRLPKDNGWFAALKRDNVELCGDPIAAFEPSGVLLRSGRRIGLDAVVFATGFAAAEFLSGFAVTGAGGVLLADAWKDEGPRAYLGMTIPGFPNFFCLYGPNTNGISGAPTAWSEMQSRYVVSAVDLLLTTGKRSFDIRRDVHDEFNRRLDERLKSMLWAWPGQQSYYTGDHGRIVTNGPWLNSEYWEWTREIRPDEYHLT